MTASSFMPPDRMPSVLPRLDSLDDEESLARPHQSKLPGLPDERRLARRVGELALELPSLIAEALDLPRALHQRAASVDVRVQRPVVEEADEAERTDSQPAADEHAPPRSASTSLGGRSGHGPSIFARRRCGPSCLGGFGEIHAVPLGRAARPLAASSVAPISMDMDAPCVLPRERASHPGDE